MSVIHSYRGAIFASLRWVIAAIFVYHGWQKLADPAAARSFFSSIGFPAPVGPLMGWVEVALGAFMFLGVWKPWCQLLGAAIMVVAIVTVQAPVAYQSGVLLTAPLERDLLILFAALGLVIQEGR